MKYDETLVKDIRLLDWHRLKNMMGILLVALYFLSVHLGEGLRLQIIAGTSQRHRSD